MSQPARAVMPAPWLRPATVVSVLEDGRLEVRVARADGGTHGCHARLARIAGYTPAPGDRLLCAGEDEVYAIAVLHASSDVASEASQALELSDGSRAELCDGALELRDREGRLLLRYQEGAAEIAAPAGDLQLRAPNGKVVVEAGMDFSVSARRDVSLRAGRKSEQLVAGGAQRLSLAADRTELSATRLEVSARQSRLVSGAVSVIARSVATTADKLATRVREHEVVADRLVQRAQSAFREIRDLCEERLGRRRTLVKDSLSIDAGRAEIRAEREVVVDGDRILLG